MIQATHIGDEVSLGENRSLSCKCPPATNLAFNFRKLPLLSSFSLRKMLILILFFSCVADSLLLSTPGITYELFKDDVSP